MKWFEEFNPEKTSALPLPDNFQVRKSLISDAEGVAFVRLEREGGEYSEILESVRDSIAASLEDDNFLMFTAITGSLVIGFSIMKYFSPPEGSPPNTAPGGWYLRGINVLEEFRRRGVASELIRIRLEHIPRGDENAYYFTNVKNPVSVALHNKFLFKKIEEDIIFPGRHERTLYFKTNMKELRLKGIIA